MSKTEETSQAEVKQEGDFKIKSKKKRPKNLGKTTDKITKVNVNPREPLIELPDSITKVVIPNEFKSEDNAIQIPSTEKVDVLEVSGDGGKVGETHEESTKPTGESEKFNPITEVTETTETKEDVKPSTNIVVDEQSESISKIDLPENIEKLVNFMKETGGTIEDYTRLNADYTNIDEKTLLTEYYKKNKPYLENDDVDLLLEDFQWDEDVDEDRDIRKKKLAFKEEVAKAKNFLEDLKQKYYDEIKLRPGATQEQQKATEFFNRYNKQQEHAEQLHKNFKQTTTNLFNEDFKGFDINVGDKKYKYNVQNRDKVAENQSNITNLVGKFLDGEGNVTDPIGYHKAIYAAENVDQIADHFYEQGKADAVKDVVNKSKNLSDVKAREGNTGEVFVGGLKVKSISGADSTKLKIKKRKFNN